MSGGNRRMVLALCAAVLVVLSGGLARADEPLWKESPGAVAPPELARLNDFVHSLSEQIKPSLVHVRVRRAMDSSTNAVAAGKAYAAEAKSAWFPASCSCRRYTSAPLPTSRISSGLASSSARRASGEATSKFDWRAMPPGTGR